MQIRFRNIISSPSLSKRPSTTAAPVQNRGSASALPWEQGLGVSAVRAPLPPLVVSLAGAATVHVAPNSRWRSARERTGAGADRRAVQGRGHCWTLSSISMVLRGGRRGWWWRRHECGRASSARREEEGIWEGRRRRHGRRHWALATHADSSPSLPQPSRGRIELQEGCRGGRRQRRAAPLARGERGGGRASPLLAGERGGAGISVEEICVAALATVTTDEVTQRRLEVCDCGGGAVPAPPFRLLHLSLPSSLQPQVTTMNDRATHPSSTVLSVAGNL
jgi:hypothetical protein